MITHPSTPQILNDVADELDREVLPLLADSTAQIRLHMVMAVLRQCAVRAGEEIAVMTEEAARYSEYGTAVADATGRADVRAAVADIVVGDDRHLAVVSEVYARAGEALSLAIEAALDSGDHALIADGEQLLQDRVANEQRMAGVATAGR